MNLFKQLAIASIAGAAVGAVVAGVYNSKAKKAVVKKDEPTKVVRSLILSIDSETIKVNYNVDITKDGTNISIIKGEEFESTDGIALREIALAVMSLNVNYANFIGEGSIEDRTRRAKSYKSSTHCTLRSGVSITIKMG